MFFSKFFFLIIPNQFIYFVINKAFAHDNVRVDRNNFEVLLPDWLEVNQFTHLFRLFTINFIFIIIII